MYAIAKTKLLCIVLLTAALFSGGSTAAMEQGKGDAAASIRAEKMKWDPPGTVYVLHDKRTGTYGHFDLTVGRAEGYDEMQTWTLGERDWQGIHAIALTSPQMGTLLYSAADQGLLATPDTSGNRLGSYDPFIRYEWPLEVGKSWTDKVTMTWIVESSKTPLEVKFKVEALEDVTVPAGTFKAFRVVSVDSFGEVRKVWTRPDLGLWCIKQVFDRPPSFSYGAGHEEDELVSVKKAK